MTAWAFTALGDVCSVNRRINKYDDQTPVSFVGMAELDEEAALAIPREDGTFADYKSGYTLFSDGDILAAKITPCWQNAKIGIANLNQPKGVGSTEFHVLKPSPDLDSRYLLHYLRRPALISEGESRMTGSGGQRRVPANFLEKLPIPLPPLDEQRRIAEILDRIAKCRQHARNAMDAATEFSAASTLQDSQTIPFGEIATVRSGTTNPTIPENRNYPHVAPDNITPQSGRIINVKSVTEDGVTSGKYKFNKGDVLYSKIRPYLNKVSIAPFDGLCSADMYAIEPKEGYTAQFVAEVLQSNLFLTYAAKNSGRASIPKINRRALLSFPIPTATQEAVSTISRTRLIRDELINTYGKKAEKLDELYNSLATRAFAGEL